MEEFESGLGGLDGSEDERCLPTVSTAAGLPTPGPRCGPLGGSGGVGPGGGRAPSIIVPYVSLLIIELGMGGLCLALKAMSCANAERLDCMAPGTMQLTGRSSRRDVFRMGCKQIPKGVNILNPKQESLSAC